MIETASLLIAGRYFEGALDQATFAACSCFLPKKSEMRCRLFGSVQSVLKLPVFNR